MNELIHTLLLGAGATAMLDLWGIVRRPLLGWPVPDYSMVGRWVAHMGRGRFRHAAIARAAPVPGEGLIGWLAHYLTGVSFAAALVAMFGMTWLEQPTIGPALLVGVGSVAAPFLLLQPATGAGFAARLTARPNQARLQSLVTHAIFGLGLYTSGRMLRLVLGG